MQSRDFCYWLQGYFEIHKDGGGLTAEQVEIVRNHLSLVFVHEIDPLMGNSDHQAKLNSIHSGSTKPVMRC